MVRSPAVLVAVLSACATTPPLRNQDEQRVEENCLGGAPVKQVSFGATTLIARHEYALEHSADRKSALWVCEHLTKDELAVRMAKRSIECSDGRKTALMKFLPDPDLAVGARAELEDYRGSGFDRGHLAPAADFPERWGAMEESFYLSNMAPQVGNGFNRSVWAKLEEAVRGYAVRYGEAWIFTGGFFKPGDPVRTIGPGQVQVPTWFYKIVVVNDGGHRAAAFVLANEKHESTSDLQPFVTTVDQVEAWTGLDFMTELEAEPLESEAAELSKW